jgi:glucoselysine-6-phosphate deglycase
MPENVKETMLTYVQESPEAVAANIENSEALTAPLVEEYLKGDYRNIWIVASGSSFNGSHCARLFVRRYLKTEVKVISPFTFICSEHDFTEQDFVFVVSQSGYSTNSIEALNVIKAAGRRAIGVTGNVNSDFKDYADMLVDYGVGIETVGYVTKGVTTFALFLMLFALEAGVKKGVLSVKEAEEVKADLRRVPELHKQVQAATLKFYDDHFKAMTSMTNAYSCSCGANYGTALEGALKIGETVQVPSVAYESEEYLHGPDLQLTPNYTVFFVDGGNSSDRIHTIFAASRLVTDKAFLLTNNPAYEGDGVLCVPFDLPELITPLCFLPFFQIIAYKVTEDLHRWPKHPLYLALDKAAASKTENYVSGIEH